MKYLSIIFLTFFLLGASNTPAPSVPIGGTVAVFSNLPGAWQPPVSGAIKDGFMRADGAQVPASCTKCKIPAGTTLPDLTDKMLRGSTTAGGSIGDDSSSITLTDTQIPELTSSVSTLTASHTHSGGSLYAGISFQHDNRGVGGYLRLERVDIPDFNNANIRAYGNSSNFYLTSHSDLCPAPCWDGPVTHGTRVVGSTGTASGGSGSTTVTVGEATPEAIAVPTISAAVTTIFVIRVY